MIEAMIDACQGWQAKATLKKLENRGMLIHLAAEVAASGIRRDHQGWDTHAQPIGVHLGRGQMVEKASALA